MIITTIQEQLPLPCTRQCAWQDAGPLPESLNRILLTTLGQRDCSSCVTDMEVEAQRG